MTDPSWQALVELAASRPAAPPVDTTAVRRARVLSWLGLTPGVAPPPPLPSASVAVQFAAMTPDQRTEMLRDYFNLPS